VRQMKAESQTGKDHMEIECIEQNERENYCFLSKLP
jgi:hypothetical protein